MSKSKSGKREDAVAGLRVENSGKGSSNSGRDDDRIDDDDNDDVGGGSTDDDGTPDQGSGDAPGTPGSGGSTDDDGTPDQGSGDAPAGLSVVSLDFGSLFGGTPPAGPVASLPDLSELFPMGLMPDFSGIFFG